MHILTSPVYTSYLLAISTYSDLPREQYSEAAQVTRAESAAFDLSSLAAKGCLYYLVLKRFKVFQIRSCLALGEM